LRAWQRLWKRFEGDAVGRDVWPEPPVPDLSSAGVGSYPTSKAVNFASSVDPEKPIGFDRAALPPTRDGWLNIVYDPTLNLPEPPADSGAPDIPNPGDGRYHGEQLEIKDVDIGSYLLRVQRTRKLGPKVVLRLSGTGEQLTTPIVLKGVNLVLFFEPPATAETPPLTLRLATGTVPDPQALIDLDGGSLEVFGGHLKAPEFPGPAVPWLIRVRGGNVRLFQTKVEGPQYTIPDGYRGLISLTGSGDLAPEKTWHCAANECVLVSGRDGVVLEGVGARLLLRQTLLVAGGTGVRLSLAGIKDRANVQCLLDRVTLAAQKAVLGLSAPGTEVPAEPAFVLTRNCAFLNPFVGKPATGGMLLFDGKALPRGLLVYQGDRDSYDKRLFFGAAERPPAKSEGIAEWSRLWGSAGMRDRRPDLTALRSFEARRWPLERLALPADRGANLEALGVMKKRP
jgi:hypothetical protein